MKKKPTIALLFFSLTTSMAALSSALSLQLLALISLKTSLQDPSSNLKDWDFSSIVTRKQWCSWSGVTCNSNDEVTSLDLSAKKLAGNIAPEIRLLCGSLTHLNISNNSFQGPLPEAIFDLRKLSHLDVSHNNFSSKLSSSISKLRCLVFFNAYSNSFSGPFPLSLTDLRRLEYLNLGGSFFEGSLPVNLAALVNLRFLHLAGNLVNGSLPRDLGRLFNLEHLEIGYNQYIGGIPAELGRLSRLRYLDISSANLSGDIPPELGNLSALQSLFLFKNSFTGIIPDSFSKLINIKSLDLSENHLSGGIPRAISSLSNLAILALMNNELSGEIPAEIGDLPNLEILLLWNNSFTGVLPEKLGSNGKLLRLDASSNFLTGQLPSDLCKGNRLLKLILFSNHLNSSFPSSLGRCASLWRIRIEGNKFTGRIPRGLGFLPNLTYADFSRNNFSGEIPADLGGAPRLELLNVSKNPIGGPLPANIWRSPGLQVFSASTCELEGEIPHFEFGCKSLYKLELDKNRLNGSIPWDIGVCQRLVSVKLSHNELSGIIPWELATIPSIMDVDLAVNSLRGTIPSSFGNCTTIESFNVSFNRLVGPVPSSGGVFLNLPISSFIGNPGLCGTLIRQPCRPNSEEQRDYDIPPREKKFPAFVIVWVSAAAFGAGLLVLLAAMQCFQRSFAGVEDGPGPWKLTSFQRLNFTVEDVVDRVSTGENIIGMGSTGTVYRAKMPSGELIAVKKLRGKHKEDSLTVPSIIRRKGGVLAEVQVLGSVRHRNIVRLLGCCSNRETTLLIYEYMPNGSLDDVLHGRRKTNKGEEDVLDWPTKYKIAMGVAQGICYLHHDCDPVIVHRDLKPSNILLDEEMEARVADFGVAKLFQSSGDCMSVVAGSFGYIAPEYAYTLQVDEKSDIYSYGVLLMELLTGRRCVDPEFGEGNSIVDWVNSKANTSLTAVLDYEMSSVMRVALLCTSRDPVDRPSMRDVVSMLRAARPDSLPFSTSNKDSDVDS